MHRPLVGGLAPLGGPVFGVGSRTVEVVIRWPFIRIGKGAGIPKDIGLAGLNQEYSKLVSQRIGGGNRPATTPRCLAFIITRSVSRMIRKYCDTGLAVQAFHGPLGKIHGLIDTREQVFQIAIAPGLAGKQVLHRWPDLLEEIVLGGPERKEAALGLVQSDRLHLSRRPVAWWHHRIPVRAGRDPRFPR